MSSRLQQLQAQGLKMGGKRHTLRRPEGTLAPTSQTDKTDKTFRIAKPMRKVSWTKRFAAGGAERWAAG